MFKESDHFYFSKKQDDKYKELFENGLIESYSENYAYIDGDVVRYSEVTNKGEGSNWDDAIYLGKGYFHHMENIKHNPKFEGMDEITKMVLNIAACEAMLNLGQKPEEDDWPEVIGE